MLTPPQKNFLRTPRLQLHCPRTCCNKSQLSASCLGEIPPTLFSYVIWIFDLLIFRQNTINYSKITPKFLALSGEFNYGYLYVLFPDAHKYRRDIHAHVHNMISMTLYSLMQGKVRTHKWITGQCSCLTSYSLEPRHPTVQDIHNFTLFFFISGLPLTMHHN